jgi:predicted phosphoribosyltransferase
MIFTDRATAGRALAAEVAALAPERPVILALPRGGLPVAREVAMALTAPLGLILVRKVGAPFQPELAIGAVVDGRDPVVVRHERIIRMLRLPDAYFARAAREALSEIERRREVYGMASAQPAIEGRTAILVDDGIATGASIEAAIQGARRAKPEQLIVAVPVLSDDALERLRPLADKIVYLDDRLLGSVGAHYRHFPQLTDDDVVKILAEHEEALAEAGGESAATR